jgi:hypothetical protein
MKMQLVKIGVVCRCGSDSFSCEIAGDAARLPTLDDLLVCQQCAVAHTLEEWHGVMQRAQARAARAALKKAMKPMAPQ